MPHLTPRLYLASITMSYRSEMHKSSTKHGVRGTHSADVHPISVPTELLSDCKSVAKSPHSSQLPSKVESLVREAPQELSLRQPEISITEQNDSTDGAQSKRKRQILTSPPQCNSTDGAQNTAELQRLNILRRKRSTEGNLSNRLDCLQTSIQSLHIRMGAFMSSQKIPSGQPSGMTEISKIKYELGCLVHATQKLAQLSRSLERERREMKMQLALLISKQPRVRAPPPPPPLQRAGRTQNSGLATRKSELAIRVSKIAARKSELAALTEKQIMELLAVLGMMKYQETFVEQCVNGEILVECDESTLQRELGMNSKVDRIRLMKIISGQYSALSVLRGEYPYVPV